MLSQFVSRYRRPDSSSFAPSVGLVPAPADSIWPEPAAISLRDRRARVEAWVYSWSKPADGLLRLLPHATRAWPVPWLAIQLQGRDPIPGWLQQAIRGCSTERIPAGTRNRDGSRLFRDMRGPAGSAPGRMLLVLRPPGLLSGTAFARRDSDRSRARWLDLAPAPSNGQSPA